MINNFPAPPDADGSGRILPEQKGFPSEFNATFWESVAKQKTSQLTTAQAELERANRKVKSLERVLLTDDNQLEVLAVKLQEEIRQLRKGQKSHSRLVVKQYRQNKDLALRLEAKTRKVERCVRGIAKDKEFIKGLREKNDLLMEALAMDITQFPEAEDVALQVSVKHGTDPVQLLEACAELLTAFRKDINK